MPARHLIFHPKGAGNGNLRKMKDFIGLKEGFFVLEGDESYLNSLECLGKFFHAHYIFLKIPLPAL